MSTLFFSPNPDIEKVDVTDHGDFERFFLEAELLILQIVSLSRIEKEHPQWGIAISQVLSKQPLGFVSRPLYPSLVYPSGHKLNSNDFFLIP